MVYSYSFAHLFLHLSLFTSSLYKTGPINLIILPALFTCVWTHYHISQLFDYMMKKALLNYENDFGRRRLHVMLQWTYIGAYAVALLIFWFLPYLILNLYWLSIIFYGLLWIPQIVQNFCVNEAAMVSSFTAPFLICISVYWLWFPLVLRAGSPLASPFGMLSLRPWPLYSRYLCYFIAIQIAILQLQRFLANPLALHTLAHSLPPSCCLRRFSLRFIQHFIVRYSGNTYRYYTAFKVKEAE